MQSSREIIEVFHLHFLRLLSLSRDKAGCIVKGGGNLRFFFGSPRFSEDLDLDVRDLPPHSLEERVAGIFGSRALRETLASIGVEIEQVTAPKQTPTTQRWKVGLRPRGRDLLLHTKIEFSRRESEGVAGLEAVDARLVRRYRLMPVLAFHYLLPSAIRQKVGALVGRREVQARDVFDLCLLFSRAGPDVQGCEDLRPVVPVAIERVFSLSHADYVSQVVAYLEPDQADAVADRPAWEAMQLAVVAALEDMRGGA